MRTPLRFKFSILSLKYIMEPKEIGLGPRPSPTPYKSRAQAHTQRGYCDMHNTLVIGFAPLWARVFTFEPDVLKLENMSRAQHAWVQLARLNPFSPLVGLGCHS